MDTSDRRKACVFLSSFTREEHAAWSIIPVGPPPPPEVELGNCSSVFPCTCVPSCSGTRTSMQAGGVRTGRAAPRGLLPTSHPAARVLEMKGYVTQAKKHKAEKTHFLNHSTLTYYTSWEVLRSESKVHRKSPASRGGGGRPLT